MGHSIHMKLNVTLSHCCRLKLHSPAISECNRQPRLGKLRDCGGLHLYSDVSCAPQGINIKRSCNTPTHTAAGSSAPCRYLQGAHRCSNNIPHTCILAHCSGVHGATFIERHGTMPATGKMKRWLCVPQCVQSKQVALFQCACALPCMCQPMQHHNQTIKQNRRHGLASRADHARHCWWSVAPSFPAAFGCNTRTK
jgi:hypothetical protein